MAANFNQQRQRAARQWPNAAERPRTPRETAARTGATPEPLAARRLRRSTLVVMLGTLATLLALSLAMAKLLNASWQLPVLALAGFVGVSLCVLTRLAWHPFSRFGLANTITMARAALTVLTGALTVEAWQSAPAGAVHIVWAGAVTAGVALSLDSLDGIAARRANTASRLGAVFDMEIDALLILFLALLVAFTGRAGPWIVLIGALRYLFAGARLVWPRLRGALAPSQRRKIVCALQGLVLCALLTPFVPAAWAQPLGAGALLVLAYSFAVDSIALWRSSAVDR